MEDTNRCLYIFSMIQKAILLSNDRIYYLCSRLGREVRRLAEKIR